MIKRMLFLVTDVIFLVKPAVHGNNAVKLICSKAVIHDKCHVIFNKTFCAEIFVPFWVVHPHN